MKKERITLTKDQIDYFHHEGFLSTDKLTDPEDIAFLLQTYDSISSTDIRSVQICTGDQSITVVD